MGQEKIFFLFDLQTLGKEPVSVFIVPKEPLGETGRKMLDALGASGNGDLFNARLDVSRLLDLNDQDWVSVLVPIAV